MSTYFDLPQPTPTACFRHGRYREKTGLHVNVNGGNCERERQGSARADRHSHGTEIGSVESGAKPCHATDVRTGPNSAILSCIYKSTKSSINSDTEWHQQETVILIVTYIMTQLEIPNHETTKSSTHDVIPNSKNESIVVSSFLTMFLHYYADA